MASDWILHWKRSLSGCESESRSVVFDSLWPHGLYSPWNSPGQNTGVGSLSLLQGIFPTQGWNPGLQHCRWILYQLSHQKSPTILEWVAYSFSRGSFWPRNGTGVSCIAGGFFTGWAIRDEWMWLLINPQAGPRQSEDSHSLFSRESLGMEKSGWITYIVLCSTIMLTLFSQLLLGLLAKIKCNTALSIIDTKHRFRSFPVFILVKKTSIK